MPKLQAARVTQCGLDFAVVLVDPKLFMNPSELEAFSGTRPSALSRRSGGDAEL